MMYVLSALAAISIWSMPAAADVYYCQGSVFCTCKETERCNGFGQYLNESQTEICQEGNWAFEATVQRRTISLKGDEINTSLGEVRPYFDDFDWYQAGATEDRGVIILSFDNENARTAFKLRQMTQDSTNDYDWTLSGTCEVIE